MLIKMSSRLTAHSAASGLTNQRGQGSSPNRPQFWHLECWVLFFWPNAQVHSEKTTSLEPFLRTRFWVHYSTVLSWDCNAWSLNNFGRQKKDKKKNIGNLPGSSYTATCIHKKCIQIKRKKKQPQHCSKTNWHCMIFPLMKRVWYTTNLLYIQYIYISLSG